MVRRGPVCLRQVHGVLCGGGWPILVLRPPAHARGGARQGGGPHIHKDSGHSMRAASSIATHKPGPIARHMGRWRRATHLSGGPQDGRCPVSQRPLVAAPARPLLPGVSWQHTAGRSPASRGLRVLNSSDARRGAGATPVLGAPPPGLRLLPPPLEPSSQASPRSNGRQSGWLSRGASERHAKPGSSLHNATPLARSSSWGHLPLFVLPTSGLTAFPLPPSSSLGPTCHSGGEVAAVDGRGTGPQGRSGGSEEGAMLGYPSHRRLPGLSPGRSRLVGRAGKRGPGSRAEGRGRGEWSGEEGGGEGSAAVPQCRQLAAQAGSVCASLPPTGSGKWIPFHVSTAGRWPMQRLRPCAPSRWQKRQSRFGK